MSAPTLQLERDPSGQVLLGVRLIGDSDSERWTPAEDADPSAAPAEAAAWIHSRVSGRLGLLCIDPSGAVCSWLDTPSDEPGVVRAAARQAPPGMWGDWSAMGDSDAGLDWRAASIQAITPSLASARAQKPGLTLRRGTEAAPVSTRSAVIALSDLPVRLLLDALDRHGVVVERVAALWHTMAAAWDPGAGQAEDQDEDPLSTRDTSEAAVVLITGDGRLVWSWSDQGRLLAAGTARLDPASLRGDGEPSNLAAGRLTADWLAWTSQLGRAPGRIICLADDELGDGVAALGRAIGSAWPGVGIDLFRVPDPIGSTLHRLRETSAGGRPVHPLDRSAVVGELAARPGRSHKAMYRWTAAGLLAAAAVCIGVGVQQRRSADEASTRAAALVGSQRERVAEVLPDDADLTYPALAASSELDRLRADRTPAASISEPPPVLLGVEQISFVVSSTDLQLEQLTLNPALASVVVSGPTTASVELLPGTLRGGTDLFAWQTNVRITQKGSRYESSISGQWLDEAGSEDPSS